MTRTPNNCMLQMEASGFVQYQPEPQWRLASAAEAKC